MSTATLGCLMLVATACERPYPFDSGSQASVPLRITASVVGTPIAVVVVTVSASDIATDLVFNLVVDANDVAQGTIKIPPGPARLIQVTAVDAEGIVTHSGSATVDVRPGNNNDPVQIKLAPHSGHVPIVVTFGNYGVVMSPPSATIDVSQSATLQLEVTVTDVDGNVIVPSDLTWASTNPAVATVDATGLVTGVINGTITIVAAYRGVAGLGEVTVTGAAGLQTFSSIGAGWQFTCGLSAGVAYCWGYNVVGQLGDGTTTDHLTPLPVSMPAGVTFTGLSVAGDDAYACALTPAGVAYCWGWNYYGQLGDGTTTDHLTPLPVSMPAGVTFASISGHFGHTCALTTAGAAYCWGVNVGQLGDNTTTSHLTPNPVTMPAGVTFTSISAGYTETCALTLAGVVYCWGNNEFGQLGDGTTTDHLTPLPVSMPAGVTFASVSVGNSFGCAHTPLGEVYCWGKNLDGNLGDGTLTTRLTPTRVIMPAAVAFTSPMAGGSWADACALTTTGTAYCWGNNDPGQLGDGTMATQLTPTLVSMPAGVRFTTISPGAGHTCALSTTGPAYCWGNNTYGQLGDGTTTSSSIPVAVQWQ